MPIEYHYSLNHANKILNLVRAAFALVDHGDKNIAIQSWSNGREQGYHLSAWDTDIDVAVNLAQQRGSDMADIITGKNRDFDITPNQPLSLEVWERQKHISNDADAADYIVKFLLNGKV